MSQRPALESNQGTPLIELRDVTKVFGGGSMLSQQETVALDNFSYAVAAEPPTITAVVGESGSGKSTMANLMLGLETPTSGSVLYKGVDLRQASRKERRTFRREVQAIFQDPYGVYNSFYKIDHVLTTPIAKFGMAKTRAEEATMIDRALRAVGLDPAETLGRYPHQLSGGQRQRVMIARTLLLRPKVIVADEPVSMVDASLRVTILTHLLQLKEQHGISLIYITHDLATAYQISDHIIVLHRGAVVEQGAPEQVVKHPEHEYTRLLIASIPVADPNRSWGEAPVDSNGSTEHFLRPEHTQPAVQDGR